MTKTNEIVIPNRWNFSKSGIVTLNVAFGVILTIWSIALIYSLNNITVGIGASIITCLSILVTVLKIKELHKISAIMCIILLGITTYNSGLDLGAGLWCLIIVVMLWAHEKTYTNN